MSCVAVLGLGSWGEALAVTLARKGHKVVGWARRAEKVEAVRHDPLWSSLPHLRATRELDVALKDAAWGVFALPAQVFRPFLREHGLAVPLLVACKGIETHTGLLLSEVAQEEKVRSPLGFLGGPHLAAEVRQGLPTAGTVASATLEWAQHVSALMDGPSFRVTPSLDDVGVQLMGALKNVLAVLSGLCLGAGWGQNARGALITVGLREVQTLVTALGGSPDTLVTQAGLGDLFVTCSSEDSRNTRFGVAWAQGKKPSPQAPLAEGFFTLQGVHERASALGLRLPLLGALAHLLHNPSEKLSDPQRLPHLLEHLS